MTKPNPYARNNFRGKFKITYLGRDQGFYILRVGLTGHDKLDAHMFGVELTTWLLTEATGRYHQGRDMNGLCGTPVLSVTKATNDDSFVVLESFVDLVLFEQAYPVDGITPAKLAI